MTIEIREADFRTDFAAIKLIRETVFVQEQAVPLELEWDEHDEHACHLLAFAQGIPVGTARLLNSGKIGRMAVLAHWRRQGVATALLKHLLALAAQRGLAEVHLSAQVTAIPFYQRLGFEISSEVFDDAGIPHRDMRLKLESKSS